MRLSLRASQREVRQNVGSPGRPGAGDLTRPPVPARPLPDGSASAAPAAALGPPHIASTITETTMRVALRLLAIFFLAAGALGAQGGWYDHVEPRQKEGWKGGNPPPGVAYANRNERGDR